MNMLKILVLLMLSCGVATEANAEGDASITVTGTVRDNTCYVSPDSQSKQVNLGNIASRNFLKAGDASPVQSFAINLEKCGTGISTMTVTFSGAEDSQNPQLLGLDNEAGSATGIAVGIYDQDRALIPLGAPSGEYVLQAGQSSVAMKFYARYVATHNTVTGGNAVATATFVISYA